MASPSKAVPEQLPRDEKRRPSPRMAGAFAAPTDRIKIYGQLPVNHRISEYVHPSYKHVTTHIYIYIYTHILFALPHTPNTRVHAHMVCPLCM